MSYTEARDATQIIGMETPRLGRRKRGIEYFRGPVMIEVMKRNSSTAIYSEAAESSGPESADENDPMTEGAEPGASTGFAEPGVSPFDEVNAESVVEALLMATDEPLPAGRLAQILGTGDASDVKAHIEKLNQKYTETGASFRIEAIAKGYQLLTLPVYDAWIGKLHKARSDSRLSAAALETLAIVGYKQPILRADVEAIRGVAVGDMLVRLRDAGLVRIVGRAEEVGRPLLYGTTTRFLEVFGLSSLKDLPKVDSDQPASVPKLAPQE